MELQLPSLMLLAIFYLLTIALVRMMIKKRMTPNSSGPPSRPLPGPWKLPVIGAIHHFLGGIPHRKLRDLARHHGPLMLMRLGQVDHLVVSSPEAAEAIMKTQDLNFASRPQIAFGKLLCYNFTDIAFAPYGVYWQQMRKISVLELLSAKQVKSFGSTRKEEMANLTKHISLSANKPINLSERLVSMTSAVITRAAFGDRCRHQQSFVSSLREVSLLAASFNVADLFPSLKFIDVASGLRFRFWRTHRKIDRIFDEIIKEHRAKDNVGKPKGEDLVDVLLRVKDNGELEIPITDDNIKAVILDMFIAGTETSSGILEWAMAELMKNPEAMIKAQKEVRDALKGKGKVEESDLADLDFLKLVIKETLRLHPPVPLLLPRVCIETCPVLGHEIAAGTRVIVNAWAIGRDPQCWEDAESFRPERFDGSAIDFKGSDFKFLPFGAGRRICPGATFGLTTVELALAHLLFYFDWKLPVGMKAEKLDMIETSGASAVRKSALSLIAIPHVPVPFRDG